jgi:hypothetical protein
MEFQSKFDVHQLFDFLAFWHWSTTHPKVADKDLYNIFCRCFTILCTTSTRETKCVTGVVAVNTDPVENNYADLFHI